MRTNNALQIIFAFFLGLVVVAFVGIGVNTFYPEPAYVDGRPDQYVGWQLTTGIVLLICATIILAVSLFLPESQAVLSNGILLGGVFTMIYAVGITVSSNVSVLRFVVVAIALAVTIAIGWLKFVRGRAAKAGVSAPPEAAASELGERLAAVERKLDALGRALQG
ncbi:MAG TPA: hypothetical protein VGK17_20210 [Propionicimonas sp.]|jgi:hypothetical protein